MSTSLETIHTIDRVVAAISRWLVRHTSDDELRGQLDEVDLEQLKPDQAEAVLDLRNELDVGMERPEAEARARETLVSVARCG
jgi:hypothetical protein